MELRTSKTAQRVRSHMSSKSRVHASMSDPARDVELHTCHEPQVGDALEHEDEADGGDATGQEEINRKAEGEQQMAPMELQDGASRRQKPQSPRRRLGAATQGLAGVVTGGRQGDAAGGPQLKYPPGYDVATLEDLRDFEEARSFATGASGLSAQASPGWEHPGSVARWSGAAPSRTPIAAAGRTVLRNRSWLGVPSEAHAAGSPEEQAGHGGWSIAVAKAPADPADFVVPPVCRLRSEESTGYPVGLLGAVSGCRFHVSDLAVPPGTKRVVFLLQGVLHTGHSVPITRCPRVIVEMGLPERALTQVSVVTAIADR